MTSTIYPDSGDSTSSGTDQVAMEYDLDGRIKKRKGQGSTEMARTIHEYTYNGRRKLQLDAATQLGTGIDSTIQSIKRTHDSLGRLDYVISCSGNNGTGTIENELKHTYDATLGLLTKTEQSHQNAITFGTPSVQYAYDETAASSIYNDGLRLETVTYPGGRIIFSDYGTSDASNDRLHRLNRIRETNSTGAILTEYSYNGTRRHVITDYQPPDVNLILYFGFTGYYHGLDRFGRVIDHMWDGYNATFDVARVKYGYDYAGNRKWREDVIAANNGYNHDEYYTYDGLHRLTNAQRGNLTGTPYNGIGSKNFEHAWTLDQLGNWAEFKQDTDGNGSFAGSTDLDQDRSHNAANELSTITNAMGQTDWPDAAHDTAGNMTTLPRVTTPTSSWTAKYDAWNRMVQIDDGTFLYKNEYDGLHRRIVWTLNIPATGSNTSYHFYYNENWQVLEERFHPNGGSEDPDPQAQFVWHPYYIDALAVRYYDGDVDNNLAENNDGTHFYAHDANYNVTAIVTASGSVLERYLYSSYGKTTVLDANFANDTDDVTDIENHYRYTGREVDRVTFLQINRHRYHAPQLGRWLTRDPFEYLDGMNLYTYVSNDPISLVDPSGESVGAFFRLCLKLFGKGAKQGAKQAAKKEGAKQAVKGTAKKVPKRGVSGKEGAKDVPSWAKGNRPNVGESGKDFAKRLMDEKYGKGNYNKGPGSEYSKLQKWGDRAFENPPGQNPILPILPPGSGSDENSDDADDGPWPIGNPDTGPWMH